MHSLYIQYSPRGVAIFTTCAWLIWFARNKLHHEGTVMDASANALQAMYFSNEFLQLHKSPPTLLMSSLPASPRL